MADDVEGRVRAIYRRLTDGSGDSAVLAPLIALIRWVLLFYRKLLEHRSFIRAGAMAYATLVAFVPLLLLVFGVLHAVAPGEDLRILENVLFGTFMGAMPEVREVLLPGLRQVDLGTLGMVGTISLVVVAANLYLTAERAYSDVFEVPVRRRLTRRLLNFYFLVTAVPVVSVVAALSTMQVAAAFGAPWVRTLLGLALPWLMLVGALKLFPSTEVRWGPALLGGTVSALLLRVCTIGFARYIELFATDNAIQVIYGSLALIPLFLAWLYLVWVSVLLGVEVAYVAQNSSSLVEEEDAQRERRAGAGRHAGVADALRVLAVLGASFAEGDGAIDPSTLAARSDLRGPDVEFVLTVYAAEGVVAKLADGRVVLARPAEGLTLAALARVWREATGLRLGDAPDADVAGALDALPGTLADAAVRWQDSLS
jgi:membrane protein